ncbi:hypothetical protein J2Z34_000335 [Youngiibacter multivorans]|uniref:Uncharacterized protein n=1 Tax=Youngiibacter multivorans TaxID=937251 RepID=A0ABS4G000_9CLOT|nr:hypothetical protein [Youngiibacter multivorans]
MKNILLAWGQVHQAASSLRRCVRLPRKENLRFQSRLTM